MRSTLRHIAVICLSSGGEGAVATVALRQVAGLARFFRVTLLSDTHPIGSIDGVRFLSINAPSFHWLRRYAHVPREFAFTRYARRGLFSLARAQGLDFVLCHSHATAALAADALRTSTGIPYGLITHGDIFDRPRGMYDPRLTAFYKAVTPKAYRRANLVVALSPHMRQLALRGGAADESIVVIPNGIDPSDIGLSCSFTSPPILTTGMPLRLLFVGRLAVEKGVDSLLRACALLVRRNVNFQLRLVGDGPLRGALQAMTTALDLDEHVKFTGVMPRHALGKEYLGCHVVCVPSRSEALGNVVLEAMAAGRAVIGTNVGGIPFAVKHEKSGLLVTSEDPEAFANILQGLSYKPDVLMQMGRTGHQQCRTRFNWETISQRLAGAIGTAIKNSVMAVST